MKTILNTLFLASFFLFSLLSTAQESEFNSGKKFTIAEIVVTGDTNFSEATIITFSGLRKGEVISIPGERISEALKKLWGSNLFSNIDIYLTKTEGDTAYLEISLQDLPELNIVEIKGVKKGKKEELIKDTKLTKGTKVTENLITTSRNYLTNKYRKDGFYNTKVTITTTPVVDSIEKSRVNMVVNIDKKAKVKVKSITFTGNDKISDKKLRKAMKNTKEKNLLHVLKRSKYVKDKYKEDLVSVIDKYKENGYRDARILSDSISSNPNGTLAINIKVEEGEKYTFGKITFVGNTVYNDQVLGAMLGIKEGDTYNGVLLRKRIADNTKPDAADITNLYQDSGYMFSTINPVEVSASGNIIDMEVRISEGKPAYFNHVTVTGNEKTNDRVIYRELRTRPGQLYSKSDIIRTLRELGQLGFFDAQQLTPNIKNANANEGTLDLEYSVVEKGSSQIELQGGYGGGGFIGTLGLSFNNFAIKDVFKRKAYNPVPTGDGQSLALRLQASRFYRTYSFSFVEPWLGGKRPMQFSTSVSHTTQFLYNPRTRDADKDKRFNITGLTVGLAKRLTVPDDYFMLSQAVSIQHYDLKNYNTGLFTFGDGYSNNLSYTIGLSRNNTYTDPVYPMGGSNFSISAKLSLPYSLLNNVDYGALLEERESLERSNVLEDKKRIGDIDQERYKWLEFYKIKLKGDWYTKVVGKLVIKSGMEFGFLGAYNQDRGVIPFERFFVGGDGLGNYSLDGRESVGLRGYPNQSLSSQDGGTIFNKFSLELRYPITLAASAKIFVLGFMEAGNSFDNFKDYNPFNIKRSTGVGLRIFMPAFGLLGIDFAHPFDDLPGGIKSKNWETHFIIGQQF